MSNGRWQNTGVFICHSPFAIQDAFFRILRGPRSKVECIMPEQMQCVFVANGEIHAQQVRAFLEAAGIPTLAHGESLRHTHGLTLDGLGTVEILVGSDDVERARELLASAEAGEFRVGDGEESIVSGSPPPPRGQP
jgi:hypothetical protein